MSDTVDPQITIGEESMTLPELMTKMNLGVRIIEVTVSGGETWQKRQYEPKNYHLSLKLDLTALWELYDAADDASKPQIRIGMAQLIREQIHSKDGFIRKNIRFCAGLDGCTEAAVDSSDRLASEAHLLGEKAAKQGIPSTVNPYAGATEDEEIRAAGSWNEGWQKAQG